MRKHGIWIDKDAQVRRVERKRIEIRSDALAGEGLLRHPRLDDLGRPRDNGHRRSHPHHVQGGYSYAIANAEL